jgi:hypothetical protein
MSRIATIMTPAERKELIEVFLAATQAVTPEVTSDQRSLLRQVLDGMLRERDAPVNCD